MCGITYLWGAEQGGENKLAAAANKGWLFDTLLASSEDPIDPEGPHTDWGIDKGDRHVEANPESCT